MKKYLLALSFAFAFAFVFAPAAHADCTITNNSSDDGVIICTTNGGNGGGGKKPKVRIRNPSFVTSVINASASSGGDTIIANEDMVGISKTSGPASVNVVSGIASGNVFWKNTFNFDQPIFPF